MYYTIVHWKVRVLTDKKSDSKFKELYDNDKRSHHDALAQLGIILYPYKFEKPFMVGEILEKFKDIQEDPSSELVTTAGRLISKRGHGKVIFMDLRDITGKIQLYFRLNDLGKEKFEVIKQHIEVGDHIGINGSVFRTRMGEITIFVKDFELLSKSLAILPEKYHGLQNVELRYRKRYLDLIANDDIRENFVKRSKVINYTRQFLTDRNYIEVETPFLQSVYGGANARPFITHHHFLDQDYFLRIAPELFLKRLIVGGFERVFELGKNFRNEDIDTLHNPEFTMLELYESYSDYNDMMNLTEQLISQLVLELIGDYEVDFGDCSLYFKPPWRRISMEEIVSQAIDKEFTDLSIEELKDIALSNQLEFDETEELRRGEWLMLLFEGLVEKDLIQPTFITDFPIEVSPLAKKHRAKEGYTERFELFINGWEFANGFSELNDPLDQYERFKDQDRRRQLGDSEAQMIDYDYVHALMFGFPPTGGLGIGIDRLVMILTNQKSIKEVILFPQVKSIE
jgi:lysyl-tRNA synthetase class 2